MSVLDTATNDLAQLTNHLDLEAMPGSQHNHSLIQQSPSTVNVMGFNPGKSLLRMRVLALESPVKKSSGLRMNILSISSLRPYAQVRKKPQPTIFESPPTTAGTASSLIGQQIAPWPTVDWANSPLKLTLKPIRRDPTPPASSSAFSMMHKQTLTPAPEVEPPPAFHPLKPVKKANCLITVMTIFPSLSSLATPSIQNNTLHSPSSLMFGLHSSGRESKVSNEDIAETPMPSPVFSKVKGLRHICQRSSLVPDDLWQNNHKSIPLPADAKVDLGMTGTLGKSSRTFNTHTSNLNTGNQKAILAGRSDKESVDDTVSYCPEEMDGLPVNSSVDCAPLPNVDQPVFHALVIDDEDNHANIDRGLSSEDDTKRSFDFTGELKKLNELGGSDHRSFVEQLENAFRTPAKINLCYGFGDSLSTAFLPLPTMPIPKVEPIRKQEDPSTQNISVPINICRLKPTVLPGSDSLVESLPETDMVKSLSSKGSRPSDRQLKKDFKFGGKPSPPQAALATVEQPLTLSDILPPPSHALTIFRNRT